MQHNLRRVAALVVFLVVGAIITAVQFDRSARSNFGVALALPSGLGGFADARKAVFAIETDPARAQALMTGVLAHRPVPAANLGMFARAAAENDEMELASLALTQASTRGWRDAYVQITVFGSALAQSNYVAAALRLEALARGQRDQSVVNLAIMQLVAEEEGREVLSERLANSPGFERNFRAAAQVNPGAIEMFAQTLQKAETKGARTDCAILSEITLIAFNAGKTGPDATVWPRRCGTRDPNDMAFGRTDRPSPYGWNFRDVPGVSTRPGRDEGTLYLKNRDLVERPVAAKYLRLSQGSYDLTLNSGGSASYSSFEQKADMNVQLVCGSALEGRRVPLDKKSEDMFSFEIGKDCITQFIVLSARRGVRNNLSVKIDRVAS